MKVALPSLDNLITLESGDAAMSSYIQQNVKRWRWINGAASLLEEETLAFDPRPDYWRRTDRRFAVAYLSRRLADSYYPAADVRALAQHLLRHFDGVWTSGGFGEFGLVGEEEWPEYRPLLGSAVRSLVSPPEYSRLKATWRRLKGATLRDDVLDFFRTVEAMESPDVFEPAFQYRTQWMPYVGQAAHGEDLARWRRFFFGFYTLFCSTNAFAQGGSLTFAPILQNNSLQLLLGHARRWAKGERPDRIGFRVETKWDERDCAHYAPVLEMYGFLNLAHHPFYNGVNAETYAIAAEGAKATAIDQLEAVGRRTARFLAENPNAATALAARFRSRVEEVTEAPGLVLEGVSGPKAVMTAAESETRVDAGLRAELAERAVAKARGWDDGKAGAALLHLAIDAFIYGEHRKVVTPVVPPQLVAEPPAAWGPVDVVPSPAPPSIRHAPLHQALWPKAEEALGFLKDGYHVLLAGAPGTGKTTVAQWVAHAWNARLERVPTEGVATLLAPLTVANSAWSPFHTIGGLVMGEEGTYKTSKGFFIDDKETGDKRWRLRPECVVLDEMNRADLDRCIGELYPLLTRSVSAVEPAGIRDVKSIELDERFRIVATVNDASIDDIVFSISEGLARRFVRIEMAGASLGEVTEFVRAAPGLQEDRFAAAKDALQELFRLALLEGYRFAGEGSSEFRIPLGVGYFSPLQTWVSGGQALATCEEGVPDSVRACRLVCRCLGPARRNQAVRRIQRLLLEHKGTE